VALTDDGQRALDRLLSDWGSRNLEGAGMATPPAVAPDRSLQPSATTMDIRVDRDISSGITTVVLSGQLDAGSGRQIRQALMKCAAECPAAVIVDLQDVRAGDTGTVSVFAVAHEHAVREYGVPVLYAQPGTELASRLAAFRRYVHLFPTQTAAVLGVAAWTPRWRCRTMQPMAASVKAARDMVGEACRQWDLTSLRDPAEAIASDLATNAIAYTRQPFQTTISHSSLYLRISVKHSTAPPPEDTPPGTTPPGQPQTPPGLSTVEALATHWGSTPAPDGKIVWVMLRI